MICGSCGMRMDGRAVLACKERMLPIVEAGHVPVISAMGNLPIVKDLVVDMDPFWQKMQRDEAVAPARLRRAAGRQGVPRLAGADGGDPQGSALHQLRLLRLRVQLDGVRPRVPRPGRAREGDAVRRRRPRPDDRRAARGLQLRARDLGLHALLLLHRALPEGRRPARRDRQARRRVDQGRDRPRHGREARELVRHLGEDDGLAARDGARPEDAGCRLLDQGDEVRDEPGQAAARCRRRSRRTWPRASRSRARSRTSSRSRAATAPPGSSRARRGSRTSSSPRSTESEARRRAATDEGRVLQGLPRVALGEGARHLDAGARADARNRARGDRVGHLLRRR